MAEKGDEVEGDMYIYLYLTDIVLRLVNMKV